MMKDGVSYLPFEYPKLPKCNTVLPDKYNSLVKMFLHRCKTSPIFAVQN